MPPAEPEPVSEVRWPQLLVCVSIGAVLWFAPVPPGLTPAAWHILGIFAATIAGLLLRPLPMGAVVLLGVVVLAATGTLAPIDPPEQPTQKEILKHSLQEALAGFGDTTVWLVVAAFLLAGAVIGTGLGRRVALALASWLGGSTLGLGYAIACAELILGPFVPSNTARGGGVMAPIVDALADVMEPTPGESPRRAGEYLVLTGAHANLISAAMFLTGMAANPILSAIALDSLEVEFGWGTWLMGSIVPGLVSMALLPLALHRLIRPAQSEAAAARREARRQLAALGRWSYAEITTAIVLLVMLALWMTTSWHHQHTTTIALGGVAALLVLGVRTWRQMAGNWAAWDTLMWLGGLISMAKALYNYGVIDWLSGLLQSQVVGMAGVAVAIVLAVAYFYSMYGFSMLTGHIMAMSGAFMLVATGAGAPPLLIVALLAYFSNLCGCLTNYSTGPIVIYFGLGRVPIGRWYLVGFLVSLLHMAVWLGIGLPYWKLLGWW